MPTSNLLRAGLAVFAAGVALNLLGGEGLRMVALVIQVAGAALLFANAARSRRQAAERDESEPRPSA